MPGRFDTWDSYFWEPGGTVLRNLYGVRDGAVLARQEYRETYLRQVAIELGRVEIPRTYDAEHVRAIHRELFGNVYEWAGEYRTVGIAKGVEQLRRADADRGVSGRRGAHDPPDQLVVAGPR